MTALRKLFNKKEVKQEPVAHILDNEPGIPVGTVRAVPHIDYKWRLEKKYEYVSESSFDEDKTIRRAFMHLDYHEDNNAGFDTAEEAIANYRKYKEWLAQPSIIVSNP